MTEANAPYVLDPKPGVVYTPRSERKAVVVYRGLMETVHDAATPEEGNALLRDYMDCSFGYVQFDDLTREHRMILRGHLTGSDAAADRYDEACSNGRRGGRPRLALDREQLEQDYAELGSWEKVAEKNGISRKKIFDERKRWEEGALGKNLTYTNTKTNTYTSTKTKTTARPAGRSDAQSAVSSEKEKKKAKEQLQQAFDALRKFRDEQAQADPQRTS